MITMVNKNLMLIFGLLYLCAAQAGDFKMGDAVGKEKKELFKKDLDRLQTVHLRTLKSLNQGAGFNAEAYQNIDLAAEQIIFNERLNGQMPDGKTNDACLYREIGQALKKAVEEKSGGLNHDQKRMVHFAYLMLDALEYILRNYMGQAKAVSVLVEGHFELVYEPYQGFVVAENKINNIITSIMRESVPVSEHTIKSFISLQKKINGQLTALQNKKVQPEQLATVSFTLRAVNLALALVNKNWQ